MKIKKFNIIIIIFIVILLIGYCIMSYERDATIKVSISPAGNYKTYLFVLRDSGELEVYFGKRLSDNLHKKNIFKEIYKQSNITISDNTYEDIVRQANIIDKSNVEYNAELSFGGLEIYMYYKNKTYKLNLEGIKADETFEDYRILIDKIFKLSPIPIQIDNWLYE